MLMLNHVLRSILTFTDEIGTGAIQTIAQVWFALAFILLSPRSALWHLGQLALVRRVVTMRLARHAQGLAYWTGCLRSTRREGCTPARRGSGCSDIGDFSAGLERALRGRDGRPRLLDWSTRL
jgi:hypothetical protein